MKNNCMVGIIGGADGPTSVYVAGRKKGIPVKYRIKNRIYKWKGKRAEKNCLKESLISRYGLSEEQVPMDFHIYEINLDEGKLEVEMDYHWNVFGISYSGSKKFMKRMKEIAKDLYLYYGVSEEDIRKKSERYHSLLAILSM